MTALSRERLAIAAALTLTVAGGLWLTFAMGGQAVMAEDGMGMGMPAPVLPRALLLFLMWWGRMLAMMLPSAAPAILTYQTIARKMPPAYPLVFASRYAAVWTLFSGAAALLQLSIAGAVPLTGMTALASRTLGGALLVAAGQLAEAVAALEVEAGVLIQEEPGAEANLDGIIILIGIIGLRNADLASLCSDRGVAQVNLGFRAIDMAVPGLFLMHIGTAKAAEKAELEGLIAEQHMAADMVARPMGPAAGNCRQPFLPLRHSLRSPPGAGAEGEGLELARKRHRALAVLA